MSVVLLEIKTSNQNNSQVQDEYLELIYKEKREDV